ncbi:type II toxin-antitoxin system Phd/YefM family antitoxin [Methylomonas sp. ZR1]|nr:type II toxin-antitoxin system Phd/YefM family antitoxin [Methylomonas sp. ZR1]
MLEISATQFVKNFGQYRQRIQSGAIAITIYGRISGYFLSEKEFKEYQLLKEQTRKAFTLAELPQSTKAALSTAKMDSTHDYLNALMD